VSQQINLFNPIFLKQKKYFSALTMAQGLGLVLIGSICVFIYANYQVASLRTEADTTANQLKLTRAQLAKVTADYAPRQKDKTLEDEIRKTEAEVQSQREVLNIVQRGGVGNTKGYAEYFRAFSRQITNGLWLTGFSIYDAGNDIEIRGRALQPELVPTYIKRLKQEPVMQGKSFSTLEMQVPQVVVANKDAAAGMAAKRASAGYIEFMLQSSGLQADGIAKDIAGLSGVKAK
jgi:hypothetical protein